MFCTCESYGSDAWSYEHSEKCYNILWALEHHSPFLYNLVLRVLSRVASTNALPLTWCDRSYLAHSCIAVPVITSPWQHVAFGETCAKYVSTGFIALCGELMFGTSCKQLAFMQLRAGFPRGMRKSLQVLWFLRACITNIRSLMCLRIKISCVLCNPLLFWKNDLPYKERQEQATSEAFILFADSNGAMEFISMFGSGRPDRRLGPGILQAN